MAKKRHDWSGVPIGIFTFNFYVLLIGSVIYFILGDVGIGLILLLGSAIFGFFYFVYLLDDEDEEKSE